MIDELFTNSYYQKQGIRNHCFCSKKCNTTLFQAKTRKYECHKITATALMHTHFRMMNDRVTF